MVWARSSIGGAEKTLLAIKCRISLLTIIAPSIDFGRSGLYGGEEREFQGSKRANLASFNHVENGETTA
jgi:hypothetical protein